jgi:nitrite reductase/ring-hydroxylating ferredoxin subunit
MRRVSVGDLDLLIAHTPAGILAVDDRLPAHVSRRCRSASSTAGVVACPLHEGRFDLCSGDAVQMPNTGGPRCRGPLPPDMVAGRQGAQGRSRRGKKAEGAPADPVSAAFRYYPVRIATGGSRSRSSTPSGARPRSGSPPGEAYRDVGHDDVADLLRVVGELEQLRGPLLTRRRRELDLAASSRAGPASTPSRPGRPGSRGSCRLDQRSAPRTARRACRSRPGGCTNASAYLTNIVLRAKK